MKLSDEVQNVSAEAVVAVSKSAEDFLSLLVMKSYEHAIAKGRKTIKVRELVHDIISVKMVFVTVELVYLDLQADDLVATITENPEQLEFLQEMFSSQGS